MSSQNLESLIGICQQNSRISQKAEQIVGKVIESIFRETFSEADLEDLICSFRMIAEQEQIAFNNMSDADLYACIIRRIAGCKDSL